MDPKIRVSSELRARDVPPGTTVTPRGREYTLMGLLGGWVLGGICMYLTWDIAHPAISALKVFGAATVGSLLGTFVSWFMPSTRQRMKVIKELKVHLEEERRIEAEMAREIPGRTVRASAAPPPPAPREWVSPADDIGSSSSVSHYQSRDAVGTSEDAGRSWYSSAEPPPPPTRRPEIERVERPRTEANAEALLEALEKYGQDGPDEPRNKKKYS